MVSRSEMVERLGSMPVIGLYSPAPGSGKTAFSEALEEDGYVRVPFAGTLKAMAEQLLLSLGYPPMLARELVTVRKEVPLDALDGVTPRRILQTLGTEWGRQCVHGELWLRCWEMQVRKVLACGKGVVADDVRFENEAQLVSQFPNGAMVRIKRADGQTLDGGGHASEGGLDQWSFDAEVWNGGTLDDLKRQARLLARNLEFG